MAKRTNAKMSSSHVQLAIQSEIVRENVQEFLQTARRTAETSIKMADEANRQIGEGRTRAARCIARCVSWGSMLDEGEPSKPPSFRISYFDRDSPQRIFGRSRRASDRCFSAVLLSRQNSTA